MTVLLSDGRKNLKEAFHQILDYFLPEIDLSHGIFIKPNIVFPDRPGSNKITSPAFVRTFILVLRERYPDIQIILGEGVAAGRNPAENFQVSGYARLAQELNIPLLDLNKVERKTVEWKFGRLELPRIALNHVYINLPVLKPSSACLISGALKNQKGLLLPGTKKHFHRLGLHEPIAQLNTVIQPLLSIMDCSHFFGQNMLISGNNCGEIDATASELLGIDEPEHVQLSRDARVFTTGYSVIGDKNNFKVIAKRPEVSEFKQLGRLRLWSNSQACTGCRSIFLDFQYHILRSQTILAGVKLLALSIKGAEIIMGSNPNWRKEYHTVVCVGACTRHIAQEGGYRYIPGCPPTLKDLKDNLP